MKDDLVVNVERDEEGKLHLKIEAWGETAQHIQEAVDYVNSRREESPQEAADDK